ncbi:MAG: ATP-binding cassette domain-containing protein [Planctomycetes bacterium]|nr:ATP-binding cassette domain-containing protein [Planctomycetota bacterium]
MRGLQVQVDGRRLLGPLDLRVEAGEKVALIGPSGAGKTTLLRLLAGLRWPSAGEARVLGALVGQLHGRALRDWRRRIGFLHQQDNLVPQLRVAHNVLIGRLGAWSLPKALWSMLRPQELDRAAAALADVELQPRLWSLPGELSGGEQQRVAIARLLVQEPELVLADEPASALDQRLAGDVVDRLVRFASTRRTLLVSLHALPLLDRGFDRVIALRDGRVVHDGPPSSLDRGVLGALYGASLDWLGEPIGSEGGGAP